MKTIKYIVFLLCLMCGLTAGAQILDMSYDNSVEGSWHLSDLQSVEYVPAMNWGIQITDLEYYTDNSGKVHVTANVTTGENADVAMVALSESYSSINYEDFNDNKVETIKVGKGCVSKVDFVLPDPLKTYHIYGYTENNYWKNFYKERNDYLRNANSDRYSEEDLNVLYDFYSMNFYLFGDITTSELIDYQSFTEGWSRGSYWQEGLYTYTQMISESSNLEIYYSTSTSDPNLIRFILIDWFFGVDLVIDCDKSKTIAGTDRIMLSVAPQYSGYTHSTYGQVMVSDSYTYWHDYRGKDVTFDQMPSYYDPSTDRFVLNLAYYVSAGYFGYGEEYLTFGEGMKDYKVNISNNGSFADENGGEGVNLAFSFGEDVQSVRYVIEKNATEATESTVVAEGSLTDDATIKVPLASSGQYVVTAYAYDDCGNEKASTTFEFVFNSSGDWKPKWTGDFTYTQFFADYDSNTGETIPYVDEGLVCEQSKEYPEQFRICNWGYGTDFCFSFTTGGDVEVAYQPIGYEEEGYGPVYVTDLAAYVGSDAYGKSSYDAETGTFTFVVFYPIVGTDYSYGYGAEYYTITDDAVKARVDAAYHAAQRRVPKHVNKPADKKPQKLYLFKQNPTMMLHE